jgi:hypothetical protein
MIEEVSPLGRKAQKKADRAAKLKKKMTEA